MGRGLVRGPAGGESSAAGAGHRGEADRIRIHDRGAHGFRRDAQDFRGLHGNGGTRAADVGRAFYQVHRAIGVHADRAARRKADIKPEADRHTAPAIRPAERRRIVRMFLHGFDDFDAADAPVLRTVGAARALLGGVLETEIERGHAKFFRYLVHHGFSGESGVGRAGRAISGGARLVYHYVEAVDYYVGNIVGGEDAHRAGRHHRTGIRAGFIGEIRLRGCDTAVLARADFHFKVRTRRGTAALENILAGHYNLHRLARLL